MLRRRRGGGESAGRWQRDRQRGDEEPGVAAALYNRVAGPVRQRPGVVDPVYGVGRARLAGEIGGRRTDREEDLVLVADGLVNGKRDRRGRHVGDGIDLATSNHWRAMLNPM